MIGFFTIQRDDMMYKPHFFLAVFILIIKQWYNKRHHCKWEFWCPVFLSFQTTELQRNLTLKSEECSGLEERYERKLLTWLQLNAPMIYVPVSLLIWIMCLFPSEVKTEFEQKIAELNRTGDSKVALSEWSYNIVIMASVQYNIHI